VRPPAAGAAAAGAVAAIALAAAAAIALALLLAPAPALAWDGLAPYTEESDVLSKTPGTDDGAIGAIFNPAQWGVLEKGELDFFWSDASVRPNAMDNWGLAFGQGLGMSIRRHDARIDGEPANVTDWQIGTGTGKRGYYSGMSFGFSGPGKGAFNHQNFLGFGSINRPNRYLSTGFTTRFALSGGDIDGIADIGIRPLGDPRLLLFADYSLSRGDRWDDGPLAGGVAIRPFHGFEAAARWGDQDRLQVTLGLTLQRAGFRATPQYDRDGNLGATRYVARVQPPERGIDLDAHRARGRRFVQMDLKGTAVYQKYVYGDAGSIAFWPLLEKIRMATEDPTVGGIVLNLSGFQASAAMMWELREKLLEARARGKKVVVYIDQVGVGGFYMATAADRIVMDPRGFVTFPGLQVSRTYLKRTLDKLGIGFDEWRYYRYKSAMETFSRTDMSPADREQNQALVDAGYAELASGFAGTGRATRDKFDRTVNDEPLLTPKRLKELGWVDVIGRPDTLKTVAKSLGPRHATFISPGTLAAVRWQPDEEWGPRPEIALVYQVGICAMDEGIKGRATSKQLRKYRKDKGVKALVIRADSPGGDPLASDLVAGEIRSFHVATPKAKAKPVIVSQGRVAASGGYWISMDADSILATPFTVTASIGVIGGWAWNEGFGKKTGLTSDHVQRGSSADLLGGLRIPLIGATLPERNLTDHEREQVKLLFEDLYDDFVAKVAAARRLPEARVREVAEGHVFLGRDALERKLVDRIGGLGDAVLAAKRAAGIRSDRKVQIVEYPKPGFIRLPKFLEGMTGVTGARLGAIESESAALTYEARVLQAILDRPGQPLLLAPGEILPAEVEPLR
jgi:protease-4